jgi:hypothetical protein
MILLSLLEFARWGTSKNCRRLLEYRVLAGSLVGSNRDKSGTSYLFKAARSASVRGRKPESTKQTTNWPFRSSIFDKVC